MKVITSTSTVWVNWTPNQRSGINSGTIRGRSCVHWCSRGVFITSLIPSIVWRDRIKLVLSFVNIVLLLVTLLCKSIFLQGLNAPEKYPLVFILFFWGVVIVAWIIFFSWEIGISRFGMDFGTLMELEKRDKAIRIPKDRLATAKYTKASKRLESVGVKLDNGYLRVEMTKKMRKKLLKVPE